MSTENYIQYKIFLFVGIDEVSMSKNTGTSVYLGLCSSLKIASRHST